MNIVIHDLNENEWAKIKSDYEGYEIISDNNNIKPCVGCFGCWLKNPGECMIHDGYECMGEKLSKAEKLVIISRYTYGGFSSFVKNVVDRSISYVLPFLHVTKGETHHRYRYNKKLDLEVIFYGVEPTEKIQCDANKYVKAVCLNLGANPCKVKFEDLTKIVSKDSATTTDEPSETTQLDSTTSSDLSGTILLNCSLRGEGANSRAFLEKVKENMSTEASLLDFVKFLKSEDELLKTLSLAKEIVLAMPLYVDGIPSHVIRIMEKLAKLDHNGAKNIYVITNMGFFESKQTTNLLQMMKNWCNEIGYNYCGALAIGAGEMVGPLMRKIPLDKGPVKDAGTALLRMAGCIDSNVPFEDYYTGSNGFPRFIYLMMANRGWVRQIEANGLKKSDLYRRK